MINLKDIWTYGDKLGVDSGLVVKSTVTVIHNRSSLQIMDLIHIGHWVVTKLK